MNPRFMLKGKWFPRSLAKTLRHSTGLESRQAPGTADATPPQHGKSLTVFDFIAWLRGVIQSSRDLSSFCDRLSIRANLRIQRALDNPSTSTSSLRHCLHRRVVVWLLRNYDILEFIGPKVIFATRLAWCDHR